VQRFRRCYLLNGIIIMSEMAGRVSPEMKRGIIERYSNGNISKAQLARENGISVSTVNRILKEVVAENSEAKRKEAAKPDQDIGKHGIYDEYFEYLTSNGISREELPRIISGMKEVEARFSASSDNVPHGGASVDISDYVFRDFLEWVENRKIYDLEAAKMSSEINLLENQKSKLKEEIESLSSRVVNLEISVGQMRQEAQKVIDSISMAQERINAMESRMAEDRELLVVSAGINWILKNGEITDEALDFMRRYHNLWEPTDGEIRIKIRNALIQEMENSLSKLKGVISA
jgi:FtsZ-binding cell division protein ZapB